METPFYPKRVFIEEEAFKYPLGRKLYNYFINLNTPMTFIESHNRLTLYEDYTSVKAFEAAKDTLVIGVKKGLKFTSCAPSADYRLILGTSCPGKCQYCYLASTLGNRVYLRVYVNIDEILTRVAKLLDRTENTTTTFEASSSSDPVPTEHLTGNLKKTIEFFGKRSDAMLRIVTKFKYIDGLLNINHNRNTIIRFSINAERVINEFETNTSSLQERLQAARKIALSGYPLGFIIAPLMVFPGWQDAYSRLVEKITKFLPCSTPLTFELIMHRFTKKARTIITNRFPGTELDMDTKRRFHKGFGKYVYPPGVAQELESTLRNAVKLNFPNSTVEYFT